MQETDVVLIKQKSDAAHQPLNFLHVSSKLSLVYRLKSTASMNFHEIMYRASCIASGFIKATQALLGKITINASGVYQRFLSYDKVGEIMQ
jgi:hypothetical protein